MIKKARILLMAVALIAFALPAFARGNAKVTDPPGTLLPAGGEPILLATNIGNVSIGSSVGVITCTTFDVTTKLTANSGATYKAVGSGTVTTSGCTVGVGKAVTFTDLTITELHSSTTGKALIRWVFVVHLPIGLICKYEALGMPFTTGDDTITFSNGDFVGTPALCEPGLINGTFTVETDSPPFTSINFD